VYEDESIIVVNKPIGLVVHPGAGNKNGTLSNALLYLAPELKNVPRAGIVHRLDKDTSGLLVVARTLRSHKKLVAALSERRVVREYLALVQGIMPAGGTVNANIGRHPKNRLRMAVVEGGKPAVTHYLVQERFRHYTLVRVKLETGRTHQIRVHMAYIRYPLVGDLVYTGRLKLPADCGPQLQQAIREFRHQALHAVQLGLEHPESGQWMQWQAPVPGDYETLLDLLRVDAKEHEKSYN
jgi:23S rRNA pseudouridine1911/1915/1917 synthase